jgi:hypothetical protein
LIPTRSEKDLAGFLKGISVQVMNSVVLKLF